MWEEGVAAHHVPLTTPPTIPFQKELTSWVRRPGASLELSPERLAEAMDSGQVRTSGCGGNEWLMGNVRSRDPWSWCSRHLQVGCSNYLIATTFQAQSNHNKCGCRPGAWLEWIGYGSYGGSRGEVWGL